MAKKLIQELTYDAPLADVAAMLSDKAFREEVCANQNATRHAITINGDVNAKAVSIEMDQPTSRLPGFAQKIVGSSTTIVQTEQWSSPSEATIEVSIPGKPGEMVGTARLAEVGGRTVETVELDIKVRIPLIAGKIEDLIAKLLGSALRAEERTGRAWLSR